MAEKYTCEICSYYTLKKYNYEKHLATNKHINSVRHLESNNLCEKYIQNIKKHLCKFCQKNYASRQSLHDHLKICKEKPKAESNEQNLTIESVKQIFQNKEIMTELLKLVTLSADTNIGVQNNNIQNIQNTGCTTNNIQNNNFNLSIFLNEHCKDAMNLSEFIESLNVDENVIENIGKNGFADGAYEIIDKGLKDCGVYKRPIHCTDIKRKTFHIKENDKWQKDDKEHTILKKHLDTISNKGIKLLNKWCDNHPKSRISGSPECEFWFVMAKRVNNSGSDETRSYNKIAQYIAITTDISEFRP